MPIHIAFTLGKGLGMATHFLDFAYIIRGGQQAVADAQQDLAMDAQVMFQQQIKGFVVGGERLFILVALSWTQI